MWPNGEEQIAKNVHESMQNLDEEHARQVRASQSEMLCRKYPDYSESDSLYDICPHTALRPYGGCIYHCVGSDRRNCRVCHQGG